MHATTSPTWAGAPRRTIGLYDILTPGAILGISIFITLAELLGSPGLWVTSLAARLGVISASLLVMFTALAIAAMTVARRSSSDRFSQGVAIVLASLLFSATLGYLYLVSGIDPIVNWVYVIPISTILAVTALVVGGAQSRAIREHRQRMSTLQAELAHVEAAERDLAATRATWQAQARAEVATIVEKSLSELPTQDAQACARAFNQLANEVIRPMSHEFSEMQPFDRAQHHPTPRLSWRHVLELAATSRVPPTTFALAILVLSLSLGLALFGVVNAMVFSTITTIGAILTAYLTTAIDTRIAGWPHALRLAILTTGLLIGGMMSISIALAAIGEQDFAASATYAFPAYMIVGLALDMDAGAKANRRRIEQETSQAIAQSAWLLARHNAEHYAERRELAQAIHGPLQGALTAAEIRIRKAGSHGGHQAVLQAEADVREALDYLGERTHPQLSEVIDRLTAMWALLCHLAVDIDTDTLTIVDSDPTASQAIADVLTNAVTDSVRHGGAQHVTIRLTIDDDVAVLDVTDTGQSTEPAEAERTAGLGSRTLDTVCLSWSRDRSAEGVRMQARIPIRVTAP